MIGSRKIGDEALGSKVVTVKVGRLRARHSDPRGSVGQQKYAIIGGDFPIDADHIKGARIDSL